MSVFYLNFYLMLQIDKRNTDSNKTKNLNKKHHTLQDKNVLIVYFSVF